MPDIDRRLLLKSELLELDYPRPDYLEDKSLSWLEAEIAAVKPPAVRAVVTTMVHRHDRGG